MANDELVAAVRDLVRSGERLGVRTEQVLERDGKRAVEIAELKAQIVALTASNGELTERVAAVERRPPLTDQVIGLAHKSPKIQSGFAIAVVLFALAFASLVFPGIGAMLPGLTPILGGIHAAPTP